MSAQRLCRHHSKAASFPRVNSFCELRLLENSTIHPSLCHPTKFQFQTPVLAVLDVERAKPDHFIRLLSDPLSLPVTPLRIDAHPLPPEDIFSVSVRPPVVPARRTASIPLRPRSPHSPHRPASARAFPPFRYVVSPYPPLPNPANQRYNVSPVTQASS